MRRRLSDVRWRPADLRWRLTIWVAGVLVACAAVVFPVVLLSTEAQIRDRIDHELNVQASALARHLAPLAGSAPTVIAAGARHYVRTQPYATGSTLLFTFVPGAPIASNHPELFGPAPPERGETAAEQAQENRSAAALSTPRPGRFNTTVVDVGRLRVTERTVRLGSTLVTVGAGQPLAEVRQARESVTRAFLLAGAVVLLLACLASYLAGSLVSAPLRRLAAVAQRIDAGELAPRMHPPAGSSREIAVLAHAFNHMLDRLEHAFSAQREFVADASHELRTPLTVIRGQLEVLSSQSEPSAEEIRHTERMLLAEIGRISRLVEDLLLLARADQSGSLDLQPVDVAEFVAELWEVLPALASRDYRLGPVVRGTLRADPDRLAQALRNLAANAIDHTAQDRGVVRLEVTSAAGDTLVFAVSDDGPGVPVAERERVFERFHRLDRARSRSALGGSGLGLAIVRAIAEAHGGKVRCAEPPDGRGARFELRLPGFTPARAQRAPAARRYPVSSS